MRITNICLQGNEHGKLQKDVIYAELVEDNGSMVISATLDHILAAIRDRGYTVEGVKVERRQARGSDCSFVSLTRYTEAKP